MRQLFGSILCYLVLALSGLSAGAHPSDQHLQHQSHDLPLAGSRSAAATQAGRVEGDDGVPAATEATDKGQTQDVPRGRLDDIAVPLRYAIELTVLPERDTFSGHVDIVVDLREQTNSIFLHGRGLDVSEATLTTASGDRLPMHYRQLSDDGVARLDFGVELEPQRLLLEFDYVAPFGRTLHGLYRVDVDTRSYAFTQLESIYAREVFPGFDQPSYKTPFEISLNVHPHHVAIANTSAVETFERPDGLKHVRFAMTENLPTYLLALAVGELDVVEGDPVPANGQRKTPLPLRGVAVHGKGAQLEYALRHTGGLLTVLEEWFDIGYPYDKLDILALPDFEAGAMENPGAITFRERLLLLGDDAPVSQKQSFTSVMAHELAHMWFGDLVTMPWWDDIWLNEAFATWMSYKAVGAYAPQQRPQLRRLKRLRSAKTEDALTSSRQIREPVSDKHGIVEAFDGITYAKGGAVINMFESYLGPETFREGVQLHMQRYAGGSADVNDFIASLAAVSGDEVVSAFRSFLFQPGLPRLDVDIDCDAGAVRLSQSRYLPLGSGGDPDSGLWQFPVCFRYGVGDQVHRECTLLDTRTQTVELEHARCPDWLMPDADFAGYYQWHLPADDYANLAARGAAALSEFELLSLGDSLEAGLASGALSVDGVWRAMAPLAMSQYTSVALSPSRLLTYLLEHFGDEPKIAAELRQHAQSLYSWRNPAQAIDPGVMASLGSDETRLFYAELLRFLALDARVPELRSELLARVSEALDDGTLRSGNIAAEALQTGLTVAAQDGDQPLRASLLKLWRDTEDAEVRSSALRALGAVIEPGFAAQMRELALTDDPMRSNEIRTLFAVQFEQPSNRPTAWRWLRNNWSALAERMPARHAGRAPSWATVFCDVAMAKQMEALFGPTSERYPGGPRAIRQAAENMQVCAARVAAERPQVRDTFAPGIRR